MKKQFVQNDNNMAVAYYRFSSHAQNEQLLGSGDINHPQSQ